MVIRKSDRVSTVLSHDESLIEVFVSVSPAFEKLRNPRMRKVMSRLVTVEQAARIAGVDADELVRRLNAGPGAETGPLGQAEPGGEAPATGPPAALRAIPAEKVVEVDVREDLRDGREPFSRIMASRRDVPEGGALCVRAIFEPVPLYEVMAAQGLSHHTERLAGDDWRVWFYPRPGHPPTPRPEPAEPLTAHADEEGAVVLDVRGLEPPEPMLRTLAALEELPAGGVLIQVNVRVPQLLLPLLDERGFTYEIYEQEPGLVRVVIRRADESPSDTTERSEP